MLEAWRTLTAQLPGMWRQRWQGLAVTLITGMLGTLLILVLPYRYEASARVYVDTQSILKPLMQGLAVQPNLDQQVQMMARTLISRPNVERVARLAQLDPPNASMRTREQTVDTLMKEIQIKPAGGQNLWTITYKGYSPESAQAVVQSLLSIFVESNLSDKRRDAEQAKRFIDEQLAVYERKLLDTESALKDFKLRNLAVMPNLAQDVVTRSIELQREADSARLEARQLENAREALRRQLADEKPSFSSAELSSNMPGYVPTETESRLATARRRLDELVVRYTDAHPDVIQARAVVNELQAARDQERARESEPGQRANSPRVPNKVYQDLKLSLADLDSKLAAARARQAESDRRVAQAREGALAIPKVEAEYLQLTRDYELNKRSYEQLLQRRESAQFSGSMDSSGVSELRVVDPPRVHPTPVSPNKAALILAMLMVSLGAGAATAWLRAQQVAAFFDANSLRSRLKLPVLGVVSWVGHPRAARQQRQASIAFVASLCLYTLGFLMAAAWVFLRANAAG